VNKGCHNTKYSAEGNWKCEQVQRSRSKCNQSRTKDDCTGKAAQTYSSSVVSTSK